jgi:acetolactate synthase-1/2/3 large subunit
MTLQGDGLTGATLLVRGLINQGVKYIFGIPGAKIDAVFDHLLDEGPELVVCRHEQNAAFMAAAVGRLSGTPGVCLVTSGPGASNLVTGLATATTEGDPVVAFAGAVAHADGTKRTHQSMQTVALFKAVTKFSVEVGHPDTIPEVVANAFRAAVSPRPGAAYVSLPVDVQTATSDAVPCSAMPVPRLGAAPAEDVARAAALVGTARLPVMLLGAGASEPSACLAVRALLARTRLPVVSTFQAAGVIPRTQLDCFGGRLGLFRNQPGDQLLMRADVVLCVGYDPVEYEPVRWQGQGARRVIHLDDGLADIDNYHRPDIELRGDIAATLGVMAGMLPARTMADFPDATAAHVAFMGTHTVPPIVPGSRVHPLQFIQTLRRLIGDDVTIASDIGSHYIWLARHLPVHEPRRLMFSNGQQTLGVALPWAIAACLVRPGEKVVSISGDGGFLFSAMELETAVRLKSNLVHFVWRDGSYNMVAFQEIIKYGRESGTRFGEPDIVKFAESFGATGLRIASADQLDATVKRALELSGPVVVDVPIDYRDNLALGDMLHPGQFN